MGDAKLTYKELSTVLVQTEACSNSTPLLALPHPKNGIEVLTLGYFLIGAALEAVPNTEVPPRSVPPLRR